MTEDARTAAIDAAEVTVIRGGNALWPGLATFTGVSFLVYLLVKLGSGAVAADVGLFAQLAVSAALLIVGGAAMRRGRYFYVDVTTPAGRTKIKGLSKAEQSAAMARLGEAA